jgi:hypothetical protein
LAGPRAQRVWREIALFCATVKPELSSARSTAETSHYKEGKGGENKVDYSTQYWTTPSTPPRSHRLSRLARALGVRRQALSAVLGKAQHNLYKLRELTLTDLLALGIGTRDAERLFYLVQWERLQAHLGHYGELPDSLELAPLLETLNPIFERHFSQDGRLSDALIALYRAELAGQPTETCLSLTPPNPAKRLWLWLGLLAPS